MLENKEFYIKLKEEEFKVELIKFSDTLNKALVFIPEKNVLEDVYVNELIIKDKGETTLLSHKINPNDTLQNGFPMYNNLIFINDKSVMN